VGVFQWWAMKLILLSDNVDYFDTLTRVDEVEVTKISLAEEVEESLETPVVFVLDNEFSKVATAHILEKVSKETDVLTIYIDSGLNKREIKKLQNEANPADCYLIPPLDLADVSGIIEDFNMIYDFEDEESEGTGKDIGALFSSGAEVTEVSEIRVDAKVRESLDEHGIGGENESHFDSTANIRIQEQFNEVFTEEDSHSGLEFSTGEDSYHSSEDSIGGNEDTGADHSLELSLDLDDDEEDAGELSFTGPDEQTDIEKPRLSLDDPDPEEDELVLDAPGEDQAEAPGLEFVTGELALDDDGEAEGEGLELEFSQKDITPDIGEDDQEETIVTQINDIPVKGEGNSAHELTLDPGAEEDVFEEDFLIDKTSEFKLSDEVQKQNDASQGHKNDETAKTQIGHLDEDEEILDKTIVAPEGTIVFDVPESEEKTQILDEVPEDSTLKTELHTEALEGELTSTDVNSEVPDDLFAIGEDEEVGEAAPPATDLGPGKKDSIEEKTNDDIPRNDLNQRVLNVDEINSHKLEYEKYHHVELLKLQETIKHLREAREKSLDDVNKQKSGIEDRDQAILALRAENDEQKIELSLIKKKYAEDVEELKMNSRIFDEKKKLYIEKIKNYQKDFDRLNNKVRFDLERIKEREKELENQLELVQMDSESQIQGRDIKILELKRKIDALEFNMENATIKEQKSREDKYKLEEKINKIIKTLRGSLKSLDENLDTVDDLILQEDQRNRTFNDID
jgi:hypothetical protein